MNDIVNNSMQHAKRIIVAVIGGTILLAGILMIVLPGPAVLVIPAGLAVLATEFVWARRLMRRIKRIISKKPEQNKARSPRARSNHDHRDA